VSGTTSTTTCPGASKAENAAAALAASSSSMTSYLSAPYVGIVVSNPTVSTAGPLLTATQNIPSGLTLSQATSAAFQSTFALVLTDTL
jgi:hypothetical protein